jgi:hypothetical protein
MVELLRHRQTKEAGTDMFDPKATASHLDSTVSASDFFDLLEAAEVSASKGIFRLLPD